MITLGQTFKKIIGKIEVRWKKTSFFTRHFRNDPLNNIPSSKFTILYKTISFKFDVLSVFMDVPID